MTTDDTDKLTEKLRAENAELREENAELRARLAEIERRLGLNSTNSSKPPSSDPPDAPKKPPRKPKGKRGAQKGHEPHLQKFLPPERVTRRIVVEPEICHKRAGEDFVETDASEALRDQFLDVPPIRIEATEYFRPVRKCAGCGALVYAPLPEDAPRSCFGPGILALVGILTGTPNASKRKALLVMNEVFHVPMSLGGLSACEKRIADALEAPCDEALAHVRKEPVAHADETGWRRGNQRKGWLWTLCSQTAAAFMVQAKRGQEAARKLLADFEGVLASDRWGGYNQFDGARQICWAHLKRDFLAISEAGGRLGEIGTTLRELARQILRMRARVRDGTLHGRTFQNRMPPLMAQVEAHLAEGASGAGALAGKCREILKCREHLWAFVDREDVEPTNNHAERMVRQGVLWRKTSFGTQSERGGRYVERVLTVCATRRLQHRSVIEFLREACRCHMQNLEAPLLIA